MKLVSRHEYPYPKGIHIDPNGVVMDGDRNYGHIAYITHAAILAAWRKWLQS